MKTNNLKKRNQRNYSGNPLVYYRAHPEEFSRWKNRSQLAKGDQRMYRALLRYEQLEEAIPEANELNVESGRKLGKGELGLSSKDIETIIRAYKPYEGNAAEASRNLPYSLSTVWKYWKNEGLKTKKHRLISSEIETIIKAYEPHKGNASEAAKHLPYGIATILKYWKNEGLETRERGRPRKY